MRVAVFDIGTNTVLCLVAEVQGFVKGLPQIRVIEDLAEITRLGEGVAHHGVLQMEAMQRTLEALWRQMQAIERAGIEKQKIFALATAGMRKATNAPDFIQTVKRKLGLQIEIIDGQREATLSYLGVRFGLPHLLQPGKPMIVMDIGGGSTEFIGARLNQLGAEEIQFCRSLDLGSVWLTETFLKDEDPPTESSYQKMTQAIQRILRESGISWGGAAVVVGIAGTVTTLAAMALELRLYDPKRVHGLALSTPVLRELAEKMRALPLLERQKLPGLEPKRADVMVAGSAICLEVLAATGAERLWVSDQGLRYGFVYQRIMESAARYSN